MLTFDAYCKQIQVLKADCLRGTAFEQIIRQLGNERQAGIKRFHVSLAQLSHGLHTHSFDIDVTQLLVLSSRSITVGTSAPGVNVKDTFTEIASCDGGKAAHNGH